MNDIDRLEPAILLGRPERGGDPAELAAQLSGRRILVTGAGGSVGSHLSPVLAAAKPEALVLLDHHEYSLHGLVQMLPGGPNRPTFVLGDVRDEHKMRRLLLAHRPDLIFHLAAYKHVPFGELFPDEIVSVNVTATQILLDLALEQGVQTFVYPSSDKAVEPPSLYGATKRLSEVATLRAGVKAGLPYCVARYANILGTRGGVVETFARQVGSGQALTVTDVRMTRYWMSMTEALWLLLCVATDGEPGDVMMLSDLDEVPVLEMAHRIHRLLSPKPSEPTVEFTGLRPGERLEEILLSKNEYLVPGPKPGVTRVLHHRRDEQLASAQPTWEHLIRRDAPDLESSVMAAAQALQ